MNETLVVVVESGGGLGDRGYRLAVSVFTTSKTFGAYSVRSILMCLWGGVWGFVESVGGDGVCRPGGWDGVVGGESCFKGRRVLRGGRCGGGGEGGVGGGGGGGGGGENGESEGLVGGGEGVGGRSGGG